MSLVELGFEYFPDPTAGRPVFNGSVYVGEPDTDPEILGNQKTISFRQEDGSLVAGSQPVQTSAGGVPLYNGSPVQIVVSGDYSIKVKNSLGSQVYYLASSYELTAAGSESNDKRHGVIFATVAAMTATNPVDIDGNPVTLSQGMTVTTQGYHTAGDPGGATYLIAAPQAADEYGDHTLANSNVALIQGENLTPLQYGYVLDATQMTTITLVNDNWNRMKAAISGGRLKGFAREWSPESIHAEWVSGRDAPIGFYSDSTTDGFTTTGHVASTGSDSPFKVTINESLNAYPKRLEASLKECIFGGPSLPIRAYNGGFDGQSFLNGFGLKHWYNTWFRGLAGSNENFSDVKMIVIGFGTSDSINLDDTASIIDAYKADLEAVIVDCFLRGVQPALQTPVLTVQNTGNTVSGRKGWQSVAIIEAIQKELAEKYDIDLFSYSAAWESIFSNFVGMEYRNLMSPDQVHPNDAGHNIHASYLATFFNKNIATLGNGSSFNSIFPGHPAYQLDSADNVAPASSGGNILKYVPNLSGISDESYIYEWLNSEGNGKNPSEHLVTLPVYVEKPIALLMKDVDSNRANKGIQIQSFYLGANANPVPAWQNQDQPVDTFYSHKSFVTLLPPGLNIIDVTASSDSLDQTFGGFYLAGLEEMSFNYDRGTNLAKVLTWPDVLNPYTPQARISRNRADYYNPQDQAFYSISFVISTALVAGQTKFVRTHYNDVSANRDSYNIFEFDFDTDNFILKTVSDGAPAATITTINVAGLGASLASGAIVELKMRSRFSSPNGLNVQLFINGVVQTAFTAPIGDMWTDGYGFDTDFLCRDVQLVSSIAQTGFSDLDNLI